MPKIIRKASSLITITLLMVLPAASPVLAQEVILQPLPGDYSRPVVVTVQVAPGYKFYYTLDGSDPSEDSPIYISPILLTEDTVLRYFTQSPLGGKNPVQEAWYRIGAEAIIKPGPVTVAEPPGGVYDNRVRVTLAGPPGATIFYTFDGSDPGTESPVYTSPVMLAVDTRLKFFSVMPEGLREQVREEKYVFRLTSNLVDTTPPVATIIPTPANYREGDLVRLQTNEDADIYYTVDGSEPSESSIFYEGPFLLGSDRLVSFFAVDRSGNRGPTRSVRFRLTAEPPTSQAYPGTGLYSPPVKVRFNVSDADAVVHFTTDGSEPTTASARWDNKPLIFRRDTTLKYFAVDTDGNREDTRREEYFFDDEPPVTTPDPPGGEYAPPFTVNLKASEPARIFFTEDGYEPDEDSPLYISDRTYIKPVTLKFFAMDRAGNRERVQTHQYRLINGAWRKYARGVFILPSVTDGRTFYMATDSGLAMYNVESGQNVNINGVDALGSDDIRDLVLDERGVLWVATVNAVARHLGGGRFSLFTRNEGLPGTRVSSLAVDVDNSVWVATNDGAAHIVGDRVAETLDKSDGLPDNQLRAIAVDLKGNKWFGTRKGLAKYTTGGEWNFYAKAGGLVDNDVRTVAIDSLWNVWVGTPEGISMYDGERWRNFSTGDGLPDNDIILLAPDPDGDVWAATGSGVARFTDGGWVREEPP